MSESPSARSTPSRDGNNAASCDTLSNVWKSPPASPENLFAPGSGYSDGTYHLPAPNDRASPITTSPIDTSGIDLIRNVRSALEKWTSTLGPIDDWPRIFREQYDEACINTDARSTQASIDLFLQQVGEHVRVGKDIIVGLEGCSAVTLSRSQVAEGDRLLAGDLMRTLHRGVALLEARLELHAPSGPHVSPLHSSIRRHKEFIIN
jgi:hypothetical protein